MNIPLHLGSIADRDRRTLLRGVASIAAIILVAKGIPAMFIWNRDTMAAGAQLVREAGQVDVTLSAARDTRDSLHVRSARLETLDSATVLGATPAAAAASLASLVVAAATDAGVKQGAIEPRVDSGPHALGDGRGSPSRVFTPISVRGEVTGDIVGLAQFLAELEHGPRLLRVRALSVTQPDPAAGGDHIEVLHAEFTITALSRSVPTAQDPRSRRLPAASGSVNPTEHAQ